MLLFLLTLSVIIPQNYGYYYAPSPFGIPQTAALWPHQRIYAPRFQTPFAGGTTYSSGSIAHQRAEYCADLRLFREAVFLIQKADLNQTDIDLVVEKAKAWNISGVKDEIYDIVITKFDANDRNRTLQLLDILSPPISFTDALEVLTIEQKSHISELFQSYRYQDLSVVVNGLIKSLPDSDQRQARRFVQALHYLLRQPPFNY